MVGYKNSDQTLRRNSLQANLGIIFLILIFHHINDVLGYSVEMSCLASSESVTLMIKNTSKHLLATSQTGLLENVLHSTYGSMSILIALIFGSLCLLSAAFTEKQFSHYNNNSKHDSTKQGAKVLTKE